MQLCSPSYPQPDNRNMFKQLYNAIPRACFICENNFPWCRTNMNNAFTAKQLWLTRRRRYIDIVSKNDYPIHLSLYSLWSAKDGPVFSRIDAGFAIIGLLKEGDFLRTFIPVANCLWRTFIICISVFADSMCFQRSGTFSEAEMVRI